MRRILPSSWRKLAVAGVTGVAVALAFSAPASACHGIPKGEPVCDTATTAKITWTLSVSDNGAKIKSVTFLADGEAGTASGDIVKDATINKDTPLTATQVVSRSTKQAVMDITVEWPNRPNTPDWSEAVKTDLNDVDWSKCPAPSPSESESSDAPAPSPSSAVGGNSSSSGGAALPVTGANTALMAGGALVLVGVGGGLFFLARRRRIRFTA